MFSSFTLLPIIDLHFDRYFYGVSVEPSLTNNFYHIYISKDDYIVCDNFLSREYTEIHKVNTRKYNYNHSWVYVYHLVLSVCMSYSVDEWCYHN